MLYSPTESQWSQGVWHKINFAIRSWVCRRTDYKNTSAIHHLVNHTPTQHIAYMTALGVCTCVHMCSVLSHFLQQMSSLAHCQNLPVTHGRLAQVPGCWLYLLLLSWPSVSIICNWADILPLINEQMFFIKINYRISPLICSKISRVSIGTVYVCMYVCTCIYVCTYVCTYVCYECMCMCAVMHARIPTYARAIFFKV